MQVTHVDFRSRRVVSSAVTYAISYQTGEVAKPRPSWARSFEALAATTGLEYDKYNGSDGQGDDRLYCSEMPRVFANRMTKKAYEAMQADIDGYSVKGKGFEVYAWNDSSGYAYWAKQGDDSNYVQITAKVPDPTKVDPVELETAMAEACSYFEAYDNYDQEILKQKPKRVSKPRAKKGAANV